MTDTQARLREAFEGLGLTGRQAAVAAVGRDSAGPSGYAGMVASGRALGLSEAQARVFATGYETETQARAGFDAAARSAGSDGWQDRFDRLERLVSEASDAELAPIAEKIRRARSGGRGATVRRASPPASTSRRPKAAKSGGQRVMIQESVKAAVPAGGPGQLLVTILTPGWGVSGHYSPAVLQEAAKDRIFPAGLHMYIDHPTDTEAVERPERSVRDLAAVLSEDARWEGGALKAKARVLDTYRHPIGEMADVIGVSIRGAADVAEGEAEGRRGRIITKLVEGASVDFVTAAGRGGRYQVIEAGAVEPAPAVLRRHLLAGSSGR